MEQTGSSHCDALMTTASDGPTNMAFPVFPDALHLIPPAHLRMRRYHMARASLDTLTSRRRQCGFRVSCKRMAQAILLRHLKPPPPLRRPPWPVHGASRPRASHHLCDLGIPSPLALLIASFRLLQALHLRPQCHDACRSFCFLLLEPLASALATVVLQPFSFGGKACQTPYVRVRPGPYDARGNN